MMPDFNTDTAAALRGGYVPGSSMAWEKWERESKEFARKLRSAWEERQARGESLTPYPEDVLHRLILEIWMHNYNNWMRESQELQKKDADRRRTGGKPVPVVRERRETTEDRRQRISWQTHEFRERTRRMSPRRRSFEGLSRRILDDIEDRLELDENGFLVPTPPPAADPDRDYRRLMPGALYDRYYSGAASSSHATRDRPRSLGERCSVS